MDFHSLSIIDGAQEENVENVENVKIFTELPKIRSFREGDDNFKCQLQRIVLSYCLGNEFGEEETIANFFRVVVLRRRAIY